VVRGRVDIVGWRSRTLDSVLHVSGPMYGSMRGGFAVLEVSFGDGLRIVSVSSSPWWALLIASVIASTSESSLIVNSSK